MGDLTIYDFLREEMVYVDNNADSKEYELTMKLINPEKLKRFMFTSHKRYKSRRTTLKFYKNWFCGIDKKDTKQYIEFKKLSKEIKHERDLRIKEPFETDSVAYLGEVLLDVGTKSHVVGYCLGKLPEKSSCDSFTFGWKNLVEPRHRSRGQSKKRARSSRRSSTKITHTGRRQSRG